MNQPHALDSSFTHWIKNYTGANMSQEFVIDFTFQENTAWLVFLFTHIWVSSDLAQLTNTYPHKQMMKHGSLFINLSICPIYIYLSIIIYLSTYLNPSKSILRSQTFSFNFPISTSSPPKKIVFFSGKPAVFWTFKKTELRLKTWWGSAALFQPLNKHTFHMESSVSQYTYYKVMILSVWTI